MALTLLLMFFAVSLMLGGFAGGRWAMRLILAPVRLLLQHLENRIAQIVTVLVLTVLSGYGVLRLFGGLFRLLAVR